MEVGIPKFQIVTPPVSIAAAATKTSTADRCPITRPESTTTTVVISSAIRTYVHAKDNGVQRRQHGLQGEEENGAELNREGFVSRNGVSTDPELISYSFKAQR